MPKRNIDPEWLNAFRQRMHLFESRQTPHPGELPLSIKVRVTSGCFHREHSPRAYALIDSHLADFTFPEFAFAFEEHETGPEILVYLALATAGATLAKSVVDLITAILKARSDGVKKGDIPAEPVELIVRRVANGGKFEEELVLRIGHNDPVDANAIAQGLGGAARKLARDSKTPSDNASLARTARLANEAMFTVTLQRRRLRSNEEEDAVFLFLGGRTFNF